jgi:hypothetical protein
MRRLTSASGDRRASARPANSPYGPDEAARPLPAVVEATRPAAANSGRTLQRNAAALARRRSSMRSMDFRRAFLAVVVVAVLFVDGSRLSALVVAVIASTALERHRQATRPRPLTLAATPRAWRHTIETTIGLRAALLSASLLGAAWLLLTHAPLGSEGVTVHAPLSASTAVASTRLPVLPIRTYRPGQSFSIEGATFRVTLNSSAPWAAHLRSSAAGRGVRCVTIEVDTTNLSRSRFDPNDLDYRLRDRRGAIYYADVHGGTGPASLSTPGLLRPGLTAESQLGFRVPRNAGSLTLVFEPVIGGPIQVHVDLSSFRGHRRTT